jgi:hypothetical protein
MQPIRISEYIDHQATERIENARFLLTVLVKDTDEEENKRPDEGCEYK